MTQAMLFYSGKNVWGKLRSQLCAKWPFENKFAWNQDWNLDVHLWW